jgi:hypothetical protein
MPDGVMTDHFRDFLKRAVVVKERFTKEGIDYLFKEKIFELQKMDESDSSTYQHVINIEIDANRISYNTKNGQNFGKKFVKEFYMNNCINGSTYSCTHGLEFRLFDFGDVEWYREYHGKPPYDTYSVTFYNNTQIRHINKANYDKHYTRIITWDANGKLISDEKDYFIGTEEWHKEQLELQKQLEQKRKKEEEDE